MPSMLSYLPAALSFAVALAAPAPQNSPVSGTVGGGANASYASCPDQNAVCKSYGVDFHNGGSYFQDITSTDDFTFATVFTGCQPVDAYNILVDPTGAQYNCTKTQLTPDNTTVTSTCPIEKDSLVSGDWSVLLYSNNGACQPFNARRDFVLSVGVQQTTTVTPMVVFTTTTTPIVSKTTVSTSVQQFYAPTPTVTSSKSVKNPTRTVTPIKATVLTTTTLKVKTITSYDLLVSNKIVTKTAKCTISSTAVEADPSATATAQVARRSAEDIIGSSMNEFLEARAERLDNMIVKRAPDQATVTDIITVASQFSTSYVIMTAPVVTAISTSVVVTSSTSTPMAVTLYANAQKVVTASQVTVTKTQTVQQAIAYTSATKYATASVTTTVTPSKAGAKCTSSGGFMQ